MDQQNKPKITFLLPYRLFKEEKEFLGPNMLRQIRRYIAEGDDAVLRTILTYQIIFSQSGYKPVDVTVSSREITKLLKPMFPNGKCITSDSVFVQTKSKTMLPVIDVQIYF